MTKKILYIAYLFPPVGGGGIHRPLQTSNILSELKWDVCILSEDLKKIKYDVYDWEGLLKLHANTKVMRGGSIYQPKEEYKQKTEKNQAAPQSGAKNRSFVARLKSKLANFVFNNILLSRPDAYWLWAKEAMASYDFNTFSPDIILASVRPASSMFLAYKLAQKKKLPLVIEYRDLWNGQDFHDQKPFIRRIAEKRQEKKMLEYASSVIVVTPAFSDILVKKYPFLKDKIKLLPNGYDENDFKEKEVKPQNEKLTLRHVGRLYEKREIKFLMQALDELNAEQKIDLEKIQIDLIGPWLTSFQKNNLKAYKSFEVLKENGYVSHSESLRLQREGDVLLLVETTKDAYPGKIFEYFASEKQVLGLLHNQGAAWELMKKGGEYKLAHFSDVEEIKKAVLALYNTWSENKTVTVNVDQNYISNYSRQRIVSDLSEILHNSITQK